MEARELRIGNWFVNFLGNYTQVNTFTFQNIGLYPMSPIELTEEILLKCGFETSNWDNNSTFRNRFCSDGCMVISLEHRYIEVGDLTLDIEIKHLHQLQNLYFALTGEELGVCLT